MKPQHMTAETVFSHMTPATLVRFIADIDETGAMEGSWDTAQLSLINLATEALLVNVGVGDAINMLADAGLESNPICNLAISEWTGAE